MAKGVRAVQRSLDILQCFSLEERELTLTEIASKLNLAKSTTSRLLATLEKSDFVEKNPATQKFKLGRKLYYLGLIAEKSIVLKEIADPVLKQLRDETGETVSLYKLKQHQRECILRYESLRSVQHIVHIGELLPLVVGASGKAILAFQDDSFIENVLNETVTSEAMRTKLKEELARIRAEKIAVSINERDIGVSGIASPIFAANGEVKASLIVSGPCERFDDEKIALLKTRVKQGSDVISKRLGF